MLKAFTLWVKSFSLGFASCFLMSWKQMITCKVQVHQGNQTLSIIEYLKNTFFSHLLPKDLLSWLREEAEVRSALRSSDDVKRKDKHAYERLKTANCEHATTKLQNIWTVSMLMLNLWVFKTAETMHLSNQLLLSSACTCRPWSAACAYAASYW